MGFEWRFKTLLKAMGAEFKDDAPEPEENLTPEERLARFEETKAKWGFEAHPPEATPPPSP